MIFFKLQRNTEGLYSWSYGLVVKGSHLQNHWVAPRLTQHFILPSSINWVPGKHAPLLFMTLIVQGLGHMNEENERKIRNIKLNS